MKNFFKSGLLSLGNLKYYNKVIIIISIMVVVLVIFISQLTLQSLSLINFSKKELLGLDYLSPLIKVTQNIQNYRNIELNYLLGDKSLADKLVMAQKDTDTAIKAMDQSNQQWGASMNSAGRWNELKSEWELIKESHAIDPAKSNFENSSMLIENLGMFINHVCDTSNITLDPEIVTYYLGDTYCTKMPTYLEELTLIRDLNDKTLKNKALSPEDRKRLIINENLMENFNKLAIKDNLEKITANIEESSSLNTISTSLINTLLSETTNLVSILDSSILGDQVNLSAENYSTRYSALINVAYNLDAQIEDVLYRALQIRIKTIYNGFYINMGISILSVIVMSFLFVGLYHSIVINSRKLMHQAIKMEEGDFHTIVEIKTQDELARACIHLNNLRHYFYLFLKEANEVQEKIISKKDVKARMTLPCPGVFDRLKKNINSIAEQQEGLENHLRALSKGEQLNDIKPSMEALNTGITQANAWLQGDAEILKLAQENIKLQNERINEYLTDSEKIKKEKQIFLEGDIKSLENLVLQTRILALNLATYAIKLGDKNSEASKFAIEIRALSEKLFAISKATQAVERLSETQRTTDSKLLDALNQRNSSWNDFSQKMSLLLKRLLQNAEHQQSSFEKINLTQAQLKRIADEADRFLQKNTRPGQD